MRRWKHCLWILSTLSVLMVAIALAPSLPSCIATKATAFSSRAVAAVGLKGGWIPCLAQRVGGSSNDFRQHHCYSSTSPTPRGPAPASISTHSLQVRDSSASRVVFDRSTPQGTPQSGKETTSELMTGTHNGTTSMSPPSFMDKLECGGSKKKAEPEMEEEGESSTEPKLPELSIEDFRTFDRLAILMNQYVCVTSLLFPQFFGQRCNRLTMSCSITTLGVPGTCCTRFVLLALVPRACRSAHSYLRGCIYARLSQYTIRSRKDTCSPNSRSGCRSFVRMTI